MEDVLDVYVRPYDPRFPVVGMDELSKQLVAETRTPLPPVSRTCITRPVATSKIFALVSLVPMANS